MDFAQIGEAIGLATSAVGLTGKAASTAETIKGLLTSDNAPDTTETTRLLNNLASELIAANMMNVQLSEALKALSAEIQRHNEFERERERYELFQTGQNDMVFRLKEDASNGQPQHFVCPVCLNRDRLISYVVGEGDFMTCQSNRDHTFRFKNTPLRQPRRRGSIY